jgi:hypothetical protein
MIGIGICGSGDHPASPEDLVALGGANPPGAIRERTRAPHAAAASC